MSNCAVVEENPDTTKYAEEKYQKFLRAETTEEALPALWHVSQLVDLLPNEHVKKLIEIAIGSEDPRVHFEISYLLGRWGKIEKIKVDYVRRVILFGEILVAVFAFVAGILIVLSHKDINLWGLGSSYIRGLAVCSGAFSIELLLGLLFLSQYYDLTPRRRNNVEE